MAINSVNDEYKINPINLKEFLVILINIIDGLKYLHSLNIIHTDL